MELSICRRIKWRARTSELPIMAADEQQWQVPALVQELSATVQEPPGRYVQPEQHRPAAAAAPPASFPIVDLGRLSSPSPDDDGGGGGDEAAKLRRALDSWGLFQVINQPYICRSPLWLMRINSWGLADERESVLVQVTNHGIEASLMDELMSASKEFFRQPLQVKREFSNLNDGEQFRAEGYGNDKVRSKDQILDWSDRIYLKVEPEDERNLALWPKHPSSFR